MLFLVVSQLMGCHQFKFSDAGLLERGSKALPSQDSSGSIQGKLSPEPEQAIRYSELPKVEGAEPQQKMYGGEQIFPAKEPANITLSIDGLPLPAFINEVFANQLKMGFQIAPEVAAKEDMVALRISEPRNRQGIFEIAKMVLENYGIQIIKQGDIFRFVLANSRDATAEPPLIVTGAALPVVPISHRPIFLIRTLNVISSADAYSMLSQIFEGQSLKVQRDDARNAVTLRGVPDIVQSAAEVLTILDRPKMKGRFSMRVDPLYTDAEALSKRLISTMGAQGYSVGGLDSTISLIPVKELKALFVFAPDQKALNLVREWVEQLDKAVQQSNANEGFFWYQVRNTGASQLAQTLNSVLGGAGSGTSTTPVSGTGKAFSEKTKSTDITSTNATSSLSANQASVMGNFVVDAARNMLLFRGESGKWQEMLPLIKELDRAPPQVLVEVLIAEVTRKNTMDLGATWGWTNNGVAAGTTGSTNVLNGKNFTASGSGFNWGSLNSSGSTRLALSALATNSKVNVLQTPKILVRSGEEASVSVAQEIQIPSGVFSTGEISGGNSQQLTQNKTRATGIILKVLPTVFSDGRIDLKISQEVSDHSGTGQDTIVKSRNIDTSLILNDGGSVLLAGLIEKKQDKTRKGIPLLSSIPILGAAFGSTVTSRDSTELLVLIVPYLIRDHQEAESVTQAFRQQVKDAIDKQF